MLDRWLSFLQTEGTWTTTQKPRMHGGKKQGPAQLLAGLDRGCSGSHLFRQHLQAATVILGKAWMFL